MKNNKLIIGAASAILLGAGIFLWIRNKNKVKEEKEAAFKAAEEAKAAEAAKKSESQKPAPAPAPAPKPEAPKPELKPLEQVRANLGQGAIAFTDRMVGNVTDKDGVNYSGVFSDKGTFMLIGKGGVAKNTGKWENGGRRIILKSGRILDSGSVWTNIANAITAI